MSSLQNHSLLLALADRDKLIEDLKQTLTGITSPKSPSSPLPPSSPSNNSVLDSLLVKELNSQLRLLREEKNSIQCYLYDQSEHLAEFKRLTQQQHSTIHSMESELEELKQQLADHKTLADHLQKVSLQSAERHQSDKQLIEELEQSVRQISWEAQTKLTEMEAEQKKEYLQLSMRHKADCKALVDSHRRFIKRLEEELHALNIQRNQNNNNDDDDEPVEQSILKCISTIVHDFNVERQRVCDLQCLVDSLKIISVRNKNEITSLMSSQKSTEAIVKELERTRKSNAQMKERMNALEEENQALRIKKQPQEQQVSSVMRQMSQQLIETHAELERRLVQLQSQLQLEQTQHERERLAHDTAIAQLTGRLQRLKNKYQLVKAHYRQIMRNMPPIINTSPSNNYTDLDLNHWHCH